ncbi:MAG: pantoate--beta-alanine ligase [Bacteroidales bacterium]|nr:pantoate--beta-alanine ligase [Bacteroidales bacterium]
MKIVNKVVDLQKEISLLKEQGLRVGLVPTMGALHEGHLHLVTLCKEQNDVCVVSVFVNPTQFNNKEDLEKYPRTPEQDCEKLKSAGCDIVFMPSVEEIYPEPDTRVFNFGALEQVMEGKMRPGHFNGVAQIVSKLFYMVNPDKAYFGEKDFQQVAIIKNMVKQLNLPLTIVQVPIVREKSGLALSSRNMRLSKEQKIEAVNISKTLFESKENMNKMSIQKTIDSVIEKINSIPSLEVEYFQIVDGDTLQNVSAWNDSNYIVGCITVYCGDVRLIDNIIYKH